MSFIDKLFELPPSTVYSVFTYLLALTVPGLLYLHLHHNSLFWTEPALSVLIFSILYSAPLFLLSAAFILLSFGDTKIPRNEAAFQSMLVGGIFCILLAAGSAAIDILSKLEIFSVIEILNSFSSNKIRLQTSIELVYIFLLVPLVFTLLKDVYYWCSSWIFSQEGEQPKASKFAQAFQYNQEIDLEVDS